MTHDELIVRVSRVVSQVFGVRMEGLRAETRFMDDLGCDSSQLMELVQALEDEFGTEIPTSAASEMQTVADAATWLGRAGGGKR